MSPEPLDPALVARELATLQRQLAALLDPAPLDPLSWPAQIEALAQRIRDLADRDPDAVLFPLVQATHRPQAQYSSQHALFCAVIVHHATLHLGCDAAQRRSAVLAALTMNVAMTQLQNELVDRERTPTLDQRLAIDRHPQLGAQRLRDACVEDALWPQIVELHHSEPSAELTYATMSPVQRLTSIVHRADLFSAKISARRSRAGMSVMQAARAACLGPNGRPDAVGAAMMRALGMYPPGTYVELADGSRAVVIRRSAQFNSPVVAALSASGAPTATLRHTADPAFAVRGVVAADEIHALAQRAAAAAWAVD